LIGLDGNSLDADGALWVADAINHRVVRVAEGGTSWRRSAPVTMASSPARWAATTAGPSSFA